jgi:hypothetical protein
MSRVIITRTWPDGDQVRVTVEADNTYPDALDEARAVARRAFADALDVALADDDSE